MLHEPEEARSPKSGETRKGHVIEVVSSFLIDGWTCECSCGWISSAYDEADAALFYGQEHLQDVSRDGG